MTLRRLALILAVALVALLLLVVFGPALYGPALLSRLGGGLGGATRLSASSVSGPLWNLSAQNLKMTGPGLDIKAKSARIGLGGFDVATRTARLNVALSGGVVDVNLKALLGKSGSSSGSGLPLGLKVLPGNLDIEDVQVNLDGQGVNVPSGRFNVTGSSAPGSGLIKVRGQTAYGDASAALHYTELKSAGSGGSLRAWADFDADARLINAYWKPGGVTAGRLQGQYRLSGGALAGDFKLIGGAAEVPQARFVALDALAGRFTQRGKLIQGQLGGRGLGGPVTAQARVDLKARHFDITVQASPTLAALGKSLKLPASGDARLTARVSGWTDVRVSADVSSAQGQFASVPYQGLSAAYRFESKSQNRKSHILSNTLSFQVTPRLLRERQQLAGTWTFNNSGRLSLIGELARQPLNLTGQIDARNRLTVQGQGLGGPVQASYQLRQRELSATLRPDISGLTGELSVQGRIDDLALKARQLKVGPLVLDGQGQLDGDGLRASLTEAGGGTASLNTNRQFVGSWQADGLKLASVAASGSGSINLTKGLGGQLRASVPGVTSSLSGPVNLDWQKRSGEWLAGQQRLKWNGDTFSLDASNLKAAGLTVNGQASYHSDTRQASLEATTDLLGETQTVAGQWTSGQPGAFTVGGQLLKAPLTLTGQIAADNRLTVQGQGLGGPVRASFDPVSQQLSAQLEPVVSGVSGQLGVSGRPGDLALSVRNAKVGPLVLNGQGQLRQGRIQAALTEAGGGVLGVQGQLNNLAVSARQLKVGPLVLDGQGQLDGDGLRASLMANSGGRLQIDTSRKFVGTWQADGLKLAGISASGSGTVNLAKGLGGQLSASVPGVTSSLSGPVQLDWQKRSGEWLAGQQHLKWSGDTFSLDASNLKAAGVTFNGQASYRSDTRQASLEATSDLLGERQTVAGRWTPGKIGTFSVGGQLLKAPLTLTGQIAADNRLTVQGRGLNGPIKASFDPASQQLSAQLEPVVSGISGQLSVAGRPSDLALKAANVKVGPLVLNGQGQLDGAGLRASLTGAGGGTASLNTNRQFVGRWMVDGLGLAGISASGSGSINLAKGLGGQLRASVPGVTSSLSGPVQLDWQKRSGEWLAGQQRLKWNGDTFSFEASNFKVQDFQINGQASYRTSDRRVTGQLIASGNGVRLVASGEGQQARLSGSLRGVQVQALSDLSAPFTTRASLLGGGLSGTLSYQNGLNFQLQSGQQTVTGRLDGQNWTVNGGMDLAALRPLLGQNPPALSGTAQFDLAGLGGTARVQASVLGGQVGGSLIRQGGVVTAQLSARLGGVTAALGGQVYPQVQLSGPLTWRGAGGPQTVQARVGGPYGDLRLRAAGQTAAISTGGVNLPAQTLRLEGNLTPALALNGRWGELGLTYRNGEIAASGSQRLSVAGQSGQLRVDATWQPDYSGDLSAAGQLGEYAFRASGPWTALSVELNGAELRATGRANARTLQYALDVSGAVSGVNVSGTLRGQKAQISGTLKASDAQGGQADIRVNSLSSFTVNARDFRVAGQTVQGRFSAVGGQLSGSARLGPLSIQADRGRFTASGTLYGHTLDASGRLSLPSTLSDVQLRVDGPYLSAQASGSGAALRGSVRLKAQRYDLGNLSAALPAQDFALDASLSPLSVNVGGLNYAGGQWRGAAALRYALAGRADTPQSGPIQTSTAQTSILRLIGGGDRLSAAPSGLLSGRATLLPQLGGTVRLDLSALEKLLPTTLPAQVSANLVPGVLSAQLSPQGAVLSLSGGRWQGEVLRLNGQVGWAGQLTADTFNAAAVLSLPDSRLPLEYGGQTLRLKGGVLDARVLRPFLGANTPLRGQLQADLSVPQLDFARASGQLGVALALGEQSARGQLKLHSGQLGGTLRSDLGGSPLTLSGALYPLADATFRFDGLRGSIQGDARTVWTAQAAGTFQGRSLNAAATVSPQSVTLGGVLDGLRLDLSARSGKAGAGLAGWTVGGSFDAADLTPLTGQTGQLSGTLEGSLTDVRAQASGQLAGVAFSVPARYQGGALTVQSARLDAALAGNRARASLSGQIYPALRLGGDADLSGQTGGHFQIGASGAYSAPRLTLQGTLDADVLGLGIGGTRLNAALSGQDFVVTALGQALSGVARGRTDAPGLLQTAQLTLHAPYRSGVAQFKLDGPLGWDAKRGWSGLLKVVGNAPGGALDAELSGSGALALRARLGPAQLSGQLSASLPTTPGGSLELHRLDLGAFWQRPELLGLSGRASLGGASWAELSAAFSGQLTDKDNQLSGTLSGQYAAGRAELSLGGQALKGSARFDAPDFSASLDARRATLSRLLPPTLGVDSLRLTGTLKAAGSTAAGLKTLDARNLLISGQQREVGPFSLSGSATYGGGVARADLRGQAYGGTLSAVGSFQNGLRLRAQGLKLAQYGLSAASGEVVLRGGYQNPAISGVLRASRPEGAATATLSGQLRDPSVRLRAELRGAYSGTLYADAGQLDLAARTAQLHLYGTAAQKLAAGNEPGNRASSNWVNLDLRGMWPKLSGQATAHLTSLRPLGFDEPVVLSGHGDGSYALSAGRLGSGQLTLSGLNPLVTASAVLTPLKVLGAEGQGQLDVGLSGPLSALKLAASGSFSQLSRSGISLPPTALSLTGPLTALRGEVRQGGQAVGSFDGQQLSFRNLQAAAAGLDLAASGTATLGGEVKAQISASGPVSGAATLSYTSGQLTAAGTLKAAGFGSHFEVSAAQASGWRGSLQLSGGPSLSGVGPVLSVPAPLTLSGPLASPRLAGTLQLVGAAAELSASVDGAQLTLRNGPTTQASGTLSLKKVESGYVWAGSGKLTRPEGQLALALSSAAADPRAQLQFRRGQWTAQGEASLRAADLSVSDGQHQGQLTYDGKILSLSAPLLDLAGLDLGNLSGRVSAVGAFGSDLNGSASLSFSDLSSGAVLPYFELPLSGSGSAQVKFAGGVGQVQAQVQAPYGQATLSLQQTGAGKNWAGRLKGQLQKGAGRLSADVSLDDSGAGGQVTLQDLPIQAANLHAALSGSVTLSGQSFTLEGEAVSPMGRADVSGDGNLADIVPALFIPALSQYTVLRPSQAGYRVQAGVSSFDLAQLELGAGIGGAVSGQLTLSQGSGSFVVRSAALKLGDASFPARIDGTLAGGDWRLRGYVGNSTLFGAVTAGQLSVRSQLEALPVGNIIAGFTGKLPGNGIVTGIARIDAPLSDPLSGSVNLVAERVRVTAGHDTLIGSGTLDFRNRELREVNLQLGDSQPGGAGQWNISGQFTHQLVDLKAAFTDTTFTPVLAFVPSLSDLSPALRGSLVLSVGGSFDQPTASLSGSKLVGSVSGVNVTVPSLRGSLSSSGQLTAQAAVQASGSVSGAGSLSAAGQLSGSRLNGLALRYLGSLSADALGDLGTLDASVLQGQDAWTVNASAQQGGSLKLSGQVSPSFDLTLAARAYNLPIRSIYARESSLSGDLSARSAGEQILVGGNLSFERLILGRLGASSLPGTAPGSASTGASNAASSYVSPLPDELTVFPSEKGEKPPSPFLQRVVFQDIPIRAPNGIRVDENLAQAELSAALTLSGSAAAPRLSGNVRSLRGNLLLRENNFNLQNAQADFDGSSLYPVFRLTAQGRVMDQDARSTIGVQLQVSGSFVVQSGVRALQLDTQLSCTTCADAGQYSQAELYSLLALGTPDITTLGSNIGSLGQSAVSTALNVFVLGELQRNIARALGVDVFRISSNLITPDGNLDAKFTVGTYLSKQFYVQYQVDLSGKGLFDATYTTPDNRFTFRASTPISGLDLQSVRPSFSVGYNLGARSSLTLGVQSGTSTRFSVGYLYRW